MNKFKTACAALGLFGIGAATIGNANAEDVRKAPVSIAKAPPSAQLVMNCGNVAAAKTQALAAGQPGVSATSTTNYGGTGCDSFVVDTTVTSASTPSSSFFPDFSFSNDPGGPIGTPDKAKCESSVVTVQYFKKLDGQTTFTKVGGGTIKGKWTTNQFPCSMVSQAGFQNPPGQFKLPAAGKTDTYRVAISSKQLNAKTVVRAGLSHVPQPPK